MIAFLFPGASMQLHLRFSYKEEFSYILLHSTSQERSFTLNDFKHAD